MFICVYLWLTFLLFRRGGRLLPRPRLLDRRAVLARLGFLAFAKLGRLADAIAQVIEFRPTGFAAAFDLDLGDLRRHDRKHAFDAFALDNAPHRKRLAHAVAAAGDDAAELLGIVDILQPEDVLTAGFVLDLSRLDKARIMSRADADRHRAYVGESLRRNKDALILATAELEGLPVVTMETKPRNRRRMATWYPAVRLLGLEDLLALARGDE